MNQARTQITQDNMTNATDRAIDIGKSTVRAALNFLNDSERVARLKACECASCFYIYNSRIGGCAMTERPCGICGVSVMYGSTNTDKLCMDCAVKHQLCKYCAGDVQMRPRRKLDVG